MTTFECKQVIPGADHGQVKDAKGQALSVPEGWVLVPPGDPALTRRLKTTGPSWVMQEKKGRRTFSLGVWADRIRVDEIRDALLGERAGPAYGKRQEQAKARRNKAQEEYVICFQEQVRGFLNFDGKYKELETTFSSLVSAHATPVGSGTVARTKRINVSERAEAAVIAWMRHQTTAYETMPIPRIKGKRREVRRMLATRSKEILSKYRHGEDLSENCPLWRALKAM
ncbi:MAG: hypothetical protein ACI97A_003339 [Planctomycetota bacterium]|jgi:hypothetical protein